MQKTQNYYNSKVTIDKAYHKKTAYKIQFYNNNKVDEMVKSWNDGGVSSKPAPAMLQAELSILNKPEVYKNYNRIINSKFTSNDNFFKMLVRNKAQNSLDSIVKNEVERISKNLDYVEQVLKKYEIPTKEYEKLVAQQKANSLANRKQLLEQVAVANGEILKSEGFNIPSNVFSYMDIETSAQSMLRQSQMTADWEEAQAINQNYIDEGKNALYNSKVWIHTHGGATTRHMSNHMQRVRFDEPFIVVNDATLEIDEMMYPCDPAGSPSNAYICYCEVEYENDENYEIDTPNINVTDWKPEVNFQNGLTVDLNTPKAPSFVSLDIQGLMNSYVKEPAKPLDINSLEAGLIDGEYKLPSKDYFDLMETTGSELNSKGEIVPIATEEAIKEYNKQFQSEPVKIPEAEVDNTLTGEKVNPKAEIIDLGKFDKDGKLLVDKEFDGVYYNENTGHWEYKGLWVKDYSETYDIGTIYLTEAEAHNNKINGGAEPITIESEPISVNNLPHMESENAYMVLKTKLDYNENTGKTYYKGLEVTDYLSPTGSAYIPAEAIIDHNSKLGKSTYIPENESILKPETEKSNGEYITVDGNLVESVGSKYYINDYQNVHLNSATGKYEYKGLELDSFNGSFGKVKKSKLDEHNKKHPLTEVKKEYIDTLYLDETHLGEYIVDSTDGVKYNSETGKWEYKGLEVKDYNETYDMGTLTKAEIEAHNQSLGEVDIPSHNNAVKNKYIDLMDEHITPVKENGEIYLIDKKTGKKYVYDEKEVYEYKQDKAQEKINYNKQQYDSTAHWGQYGHQILNGLIYSIEKYGYDVYKPYLDQALPTINEIRAKNKKIYAEKDINKRELLEFQRDELINKLGDIVDNIPRQSGCSASLKNIQNAMWEMVYMDEAIIKSPALLQDTFLVRFGHFGEELCEIGKTVNLEGYTSTTYESGSASHFEEKMKDNPNRWAILIMADEGTSGIRLNNQFDALTTEREWCLPRDQDFEVVGYNVAERTVVLKCKKNKLYN